MSDEEYIMRIISVFGGIIIAGFAIVFLTALIEKYFPVKKKTK